MIIKEKCPCGRLDFKGQNSANPTDYSIEKTLEKIYKRYIDNIREKEKLKNSVIE